MNTMLDKKHARLQLYSVEDLPGVILKLIQKSPTLDDSGGSLDSFKDVRQLLPDREERLYTQEGKEKKHQQPTSSLFRNAPSKKRIMKTVNSAKNLKPASAAEILVKKMAQDFRISMKTSKSNNNLLPLSNILGSSLKNFSQSSQNTAFAKLFNAFTFDDIESVYVDVGAGPLDKELLQRGLVRKPEVRLLGYQSTKMQNNIAMVEAGKKKSDKTKAEQLRKVSTLLDR